ncbi:MAG: serine/threonine-protein kinase [Planctomycetota bacterium]
MSAAYPRPFARYTLLAQLGEGGMGVVHRAIDPALGVEVALKTCRPELAEGEDLARFMREGRLLAQLRHPHLVSLLDVGVHEGTPYLVMELVRGRDLQHRLREGPFAPQEAVEVVRKPPSAAGALHAQGVVHRDVKPGKRVPLTPDGEPVLTDLGSVWVETHSLTRAAGDPGLPAPEQARATSGTLPRRRCLVRSCS